MPLDIPDDKNSRASDEVSRAGEDAAFAEDGMGTNAADGATNSALAASAVAGTSFVVYVLVVFMEVFFLFGPYFGLEELFFFFGAPLESE